VPKGKLQGRKKVKEKVKPFRERLKAGKEFKGGDKERSPKRISSPPSSRRKTQAMKRQTTWGK